MLKRWNHSATTSNYAVTYYQSLEQVHWQLGLTKLKKWKDFQKALKNLWKLV